MVEISEISGNIAQDLCRKITADLPEYFGQPDENEKYALGVSFKKNFAAKVDNECVGLISIDFPYPHNAHIYWMAVLRKHQSQNIGYKLIRAVHDYAIENNIKTMTVGAGAPSHADQNYLRTYNFYISNSFLPLFNVKPEGYKWEMVYMLKRLESTTVENQKNVSASYEKISKWYDQHRCRDLFEKPWLDKAMANLKPGATILDLGCGMGEPIAQYFIEQGYAVTGIDGSRQLIEMAKKRLPQGQFLVADMRALSLGKTFDCIIAWDSFFHLNQADQRAMFLTFRDHLKTAGMLLLTSGFEAGEIWSDNGGENLYHASLSPDAYKQILSKHDFELLDYKINDKDCHDHTVWLARLK